jgi:hypothetical protein
VRVVGTTLLVTIDTEEEFDWDAPVNPASRSVDHTVHLPRLQDLFDEVGVRATYVVDYPIASTPKSIEVFREFLARGTCEIGAHLHPWVNPPEEEEICPRNSFMSNLPLDLQQRKLKALTDTIEASFGRRPTTFKAGRYGIDFRLIPYMAELGYRVDTSVIAYMDFSDEDGPDFSTFGITPFRLESPLVPDMNGHRPLVEIPCTVGFTRRPFGRWSRVHKFLSNPKLRPLRPIGIMWHLGVLRKIVLTPEGTELDDQLRLLKVLGRDEDAVLNVTLHSPSIEPGRTPYVRTDAELTSFLERLRGTLQYAISDLNARCLTMTEYANEFEQNGNTAL